MRSLRTVKVPKVVRKGNSNPLPLGMGSRQRMIRMYRSSDFLQIMEISNSAYTGDRRPPLNIMEMMISISDTFLAINPDSVGKIRGFAIVKNVSQPYLWSIAVHPNFQGAGIGGCLLRNIITQYTQTGSKEITLHVAADNPAQRLYFDHGFRVKNVEENYFDPIDGLVMVKKL